jgi:hypothetical protein
MPVYVTRDVADTGGGSQTFRVAGMTDTPKGAMFIVANADTNGVAYNGGSISFGATDGSNQWAAGGWSEDALGGNSDAARQMATTVVVWLRYDHSNIGSAQFTQFEADAGGSGAGVTVNWSATPDIAFYVTIVFFAGDDLNVQAGTTQISTTDNDPVEETSLTFEPTGVLFGTHHTNAFGTLDHFPPSFGVATNNIDDSITQHCLGLGVRDQVSPTVANAILATNRIGSLPWAGAVLRSCELTSFSPSGFTLTTRDGGGDASRYGWLALSGVVPYVGTVDTPTSAQGDGSYDFATTGVDPSFVMLCPSTLTATDTVAEDNTAGVWGISVLGSGDQFCTTVCDEDNAGPSNTQGLTSNKALHVPVDNGGTGYEADFVSFGTEEFTLNFTEELATSRKVMVLALESTEAADTGEAPPVSSTLFRSTSEYAQIAHSGNTPLKMSSEYVQILMETPETWDVSADLSIPTEYKSDIGSNSNIPVEWESIQIQTTSRNIPVEWISPVGIFSPDTPGKGASFNIPVEWKSTIGISSTDTGDGAFFNIPVEYVYKEVKSPITIEGIIPVEYQAEVVNYGFHTKRNIPVEWTSLVGIFSPDTPGRGVSFNIPVEWKSTIGISSTDTGDGAFFNIPVEWVSPVGIFSPDTPGKGASFNIPVEWKSTIGISSTDTGDGAFFNIPVEYIYEEVQSPITIEGIIPVEYISEISITGFSTERNIPVEWVEGEDESGTGDDPPCIEIVNCIDNEPTGIQELGSYTVHIGGIVPRRFLGVPAPLTDETNYTIDIALITGKWCPRFDDPEYYTGDLPTGQYNSVDS